MVKEIVISVKRTRYEVYTINADNGYIMPVGTKGTVEFVDNVQTEVKHGGTIPDDGQTSETCEITNIEYTDEV